MESKARKKNKSVSGLVSTMLLCVAVALCLVVSVQVTTRGYVKFFNFSMFRVVTGSMEPTLSVGSLLLCKSENIETIQTDDIVCFRSQESGRFGQVVTHRVVAVLEDSNGAVYLETKGDANLSPDGSLVREDNLIGRVVWHTGQENPIQRVITFVTGKVGFLMCIVFPILLLSGLILRDNVKNMQKEMRKAIDAFVLEGTSKERPLTIEDLFTQEEYQEMYERIRAELMEELKQNEADKTSNSEQGQDEAEKASDSDKGQQEEQ